MKKTKKMNVVLAMVLSMTLLFGATISVNAASSTVTFTVEQSDITTAVTVPGQLPIIFNADGTNTYPTNWKVYNNSELGAVRLKLVELNQRNDWELVNESTDITANTHDSKEIKFYMGVPNKLRIFAPYSGGGSKMSFEEGYEVVIPAGGSQQFDFKIERGAFRTALSEEIINSLYLFGDNSYITNSLDFLRSETTEGVWMNMIPSYSAWWVINLCDYYSLTGNKGYFDKNREYLLEIMKHFNDCISEDGNMDFQQSSEYISFFLDWPTCGTDDAVIGTAAIIILAAKKYLAIEKNIVCEEIVRKLEKYLNQPCKYKQTRAFQILAGRNVENEAEFLEHNGAEGYSTFMSLGSNSRNLMWKGLELTFSMIRLQMNYALLYGAKGLQCYGVAGSVCSPNKMDEKRRILESDFTGGCFLMIINNRLL